MLYAIRRLILAHPNRAICLCGLGLLLAPFATAMLLMTVYNAYDRGLIPSGRLMDSVFWFMGAFRYVGISCWIAGGSLIAIGVALEFRRNAQRWQKSSTRMSGTAPLDSHD